MKFSRYAIVANYFGKFEDESILAVTDNVHDAKFICDSMNKALEDRPFDITFKKIADDYDPVLDDLQHALFCADQGEEND